MENFIRSPIIENWIELYKPKEKLIICSPYIKEHALRDIIGLYNVIENEIELIVLTSGKKENFAQGSSDISAIAFLSEINNVKVYLIDNLHMKAYCVDDEHLLITSGNCTRGGLYPGGNIEAGHAVNNSHEIQLFTDYFNEIIFQSLKLESQNDITYYCYEVISWINKNKIDVRKANQAAMKLKITEKKQQSKYRMRIASKKPTRKRKHRFIPSTHSSMRQAIIARTTLDFMDITNETAYFIGGLLLNSGKTCSYKNKDYFFIPYRYNNQPDNPSFSSIVNKHHEQVLKIIDCISSNIICKTSNDLNGVNLEFGSLLGFAVLFPVNDDYNGFYDFSIEIINKLSMLDQATITCCVVGMFDSRGYVDTHRNLFVIDVDSEQTGDLVGRLINMCGINYNINPPRERSSSTATPRKHQLRVNLKEYFSKVGIISPGKYVKAKKSLSSKSKTQLADNLLPELKKIII